MLVIAPMILLCWHVIVSMTVHVRMHFIVPMLLSLLPMPVFVPTLDLVLMACCCSDD